MSQTVSFWNSQLTHKLETSFKTYAKRKQRKENMHTCQMAKYEHKCALVWTK